MTSINYLVYILISILVLYLVLKLFILLKKSYELLILLKIKEKIENRVNNFNKPILAPGIKIINNKLCLSVCIDINYNCYKSGNNLICEN
jgi:hypothetical protein